MKFHRLILVVGLGLFMTGCQTIGFYSQAVTGQLEVMSGRKPIDHVIAETNDVELRDRLELTKRLLAFAERELLLTTNGSYTLYRELGRKHLVWVVYATPELSMEPKEWWYPVVGKQAYRGYFHEELAIEEVSRLEKKGYETWMGGVDAYSTLGWFRDPVLDTFVGRAEVDYAELLFHELVHQKHFRSGDTAFSEALAEAVSREGLRRWYRHTGRPDLVAKYNERLRRLGQAREAIGGTANRLAVLYQSEMGDEEKRQLKKKEITLLKKRLRELRTEWGRGLKSWIEEPINNARLNSFTTYEAGVPRFVELLETCNGDFSLFWKRVKDLEQ